MVATLGTLSTVHSRRLDAQAAASSGYIGPLTGITKGLEDRRFDPVAYARDRYAQAARRLRFQARTRTEAEDWQKTLRAKLTELVGGFPSQRKPLRPITLDTRTFPGYRREKIVFDSGPGASVLAYLLLPEKAQTPAATMICVPGTTSPFRWRKPASPRWRSNRWDSGAGGIQSTPVRACRAKRASPWLEVHCSSARR